MNPAERRAFLGLVRRLLGDETAEPDLDVLPAQAVRAHLLGPLAYRVGATKFKQDHVVSALQVERRRPTIDEAVRALVDAGAPPMLLKGVAYAGALYPDPADRPMSDIDLLVRSSEFDRAAHALRRLGYWHAGGRHQLARSHHAVTFKRRESAIDLHRHVIHEGRTRIDMGAVWGESRPAPFVGAVRAAPAHEFLLHIAHMVRHEFAVPLINFVDAARLRVPCGSLATTWGLCRALRVLDDSVARLMGEARRSMAPTLDELLGQDPARLVRIARKIRYLDGYRAAAALGLSTLRGMAATWLGTDPL